MTTSWNRNDPGSQLEALQREISEKERIEEELRIKERMLSEAERLAQVGSWEWNPTSNRVRGSDEFNRIYGFEPGTEVAPEQILSRVHPEDREEVEQEWVRTINDRDGQKVEYRYEYAPTKFRTIYADSRIIENEHGQITRMAGMVRDITEERRAQAALAASEERYRTFIRQSLEGMARFEVVPPVPTDLPIEQQVQRILNDAIVAECNDSFTRMYGVETIDELIGCRLAELSRVDDNPKPAWLAEFADHGYRFQGELTERDPSGQLRDFHRTVTGIVERDRLTRVWTLQRDIGRRKRQEERLKYLANFDALTDLPNRFLFQDRMRQGLARARRSGRRLAVHYLDLDNFKNVNDTLGHSVGDELLKAVARRLSKLVRESDTVSRLGGDEFAIIQPGVETPQESVGALAEKVIASVARPFTLGEHEIHTGASIGIAVSEEESRAATLMAQADTALHKAKDAGRGIYRFHSEEMAREVRAYVDLAQDLRRAIEQGDLELEYQPLVHLESGATAGLEALARWTHPDRGRVSPSVFIPVAESSGTIIQLGEWVMETACAQRRQWSDDGVAEFPISVNLSAIQLKHPRLAERVIACMTEAGVEPEWLELELTETTLMAGRREVRSTLDQLRDHGVRFAIDDFGTGYSSLQYVSSFPVSKLKIAREFVRGLDEDPRSRAIVEAVINLGKALGIDVLAEGVETEAQASILRSSGCKFAQGFLYSKPMPAHRVPSWLETTAPRQADDADA